MCQYESRCPPRFGKIDTVWPRTPARPGSIDRLAESIRQKLALPADVLKQLKASSFQPTSQSVAALREYNQGIGFQRDGKNLEAQKQFEIATKEDSSFALAFSKLLCLWVRPMRTS